MKITTKQVVLATSALLMMSGCAQKVQIKALQPAEISRSAETKKIAVSQFTNDTSVSLSSKIEAKIAQHRLDGKPYFTTLSRQDLDKVLKEQKIQNSGLIDPSTAVEVGKVMGAQAIISGSVGKPSSSDTFYYEARTKCNKDGQCWEVKVSCQKRIAGLSSEIRMIDTKKGDIIYGDTINKTEEWTHCNDDSRALPSTEMAAQTLADRIGNAFVYKLVPHYVYFTVELLEDPDLEYTENQEKLLKNSLAFIKQNRYDKAEELLSRLIESTDEKSYVPIYNIAVIKEAQGKYEEAKALYSQADKLTIEPVEQINTAINHIDKIIEQNKQALNQIEKNS
jgi:tetratricopeptide (TPR) repeat protein